MKNKKKVIAWIIMASVVLAVLLADLLSKHFTVGIDQNVIPGFFKFFYTQNTGAAWSMFSDGTLALTIISGLGIILIIAYAIFSKSTSKFFYVCLALILGGAAGNMVDRIAFGYVRDFIKLEFINFPVFNIADSCLTVGIILLCVYYIIEIVKESKHDKQNKNRDQ